MVLASMPNMAVAAGAVEMRVRPLVVLPQAARPYSVQAQAAEVVLAVHRMVAGGAHGGRIPLAVGVRPILAVIILAIRMNLDAVTAAAAGQMRMRGEPVGCRVVAAAAGGQPLAITRRAAWALRAKSVCGLTR